MKYNYVAVNHKNRKYKGEMIADSIGEVSQNLQARGLTALSITEAVTIKVNREEQSIWEKEFGSGDIYNTKINKKRILTFCHQMGLMMKAGISLSTGMEVMLDTEKDKKMRKILTEVNTELYNGVPLSAALSRFKTFPDTVINLVQAGEANGRLDYAFEQSSMILEKEMKLRSQVVSALVYPLFLVVLTFVVVIVLSVVVLPKFSDLFADFGEELPGITKSVMGFSDFIIGYWYILLLIIGAIVTTFVLLLKYNENIAMWWASAQLKFPLIGSVLKTTAIARFCRVMSSLSDAGVSILKSLELSRNIIPNIYIKDCLTQVVEDVKIGTPINVSMSRYPDVFDALLVSMIRVGEESGMISDSLNKTADLFERQAEDITIRLTEAMTPIMIILIAVVIGVVVLSIVIPLFQMYDIIAQSN